MAQPASKRLVTEAAVAGHVAANLPARLSDTALNATFVPFAGTAPKVVTDVMQAGQAGVINWVKNSTTGYLVHLTSGVPDAMIMGVGVDTLGAQGILVSHKVGGGSAGIILDHQAGIDDLVEDKYSFGFLGKQSSAAASMVYLHSAAAGSAPVLTLAVTAYGAGQVLADHVLSDGSTSWRVFADTGRQEFLKPALFGAASFAGGGTVLSFDRAGNANAEVRMYRPTGAANQFYPSRLAAVDDELQIRVGMPSTTADGTEATAAGIRMRNPGGWAQIGFFGQTPIGQPTAVPVTVAAVHAALVQLGLITA